MNTHLKDLLLTLALLTGIDQTARAQNLFEADAGSGNIYEFTNNAGVLSTNHITFASGLNSPTVLAFDKTGNLFAGCVNGIIEIMPGGVQTNFASNVNNCWGLAFDGAGNLYAANGGTTVTKITPGGAQSTFASGLASAFGLAFNSVGNLFVADDGRGSDTGDVTQITPDGTPSLFAPALGAIGVAFDSAGNLYVSDDNGASGSYITKITPGGTSTNFASVSGYPREPAIDSAGNIFVADGQSIIIEITPSGVQSTFASGLSGPEGLAFQPSISQPALPTLGIGTYSGQPAVFFPTATGTNYVLQMSTNLSPGPWVTISNGIIISGLVITNLPVNAVFRLH